MIRQMCAMGLMLLAVLALATSAALGQGVPPAGTGGDGLAPPVQQPVPNNPNAVDPPVPSQQQATPAVPVEEMSSVACLVWGIVVLGVVALLIWLFGSRRRRELRGAPYADPSHNPGASGPYFQEYGAQPGMAGTGGFLGGLPGVYLVSRLFRRKRRDKGN